jgi:hypothetical protein
MMTTAKTIEQAAEELRSAREAHNAAHALLNEAQRNETTALNALNSAQRAFDEAVAAIKKDAPWNSDWNAERRRREQKAA